MALSKGLIAPLIWIWLEFSDARQSAKMVKLEIPSSYGLLADLIQIINFLCLWRVEVMGAAGGFVLRQLFRRWHASDWTATQTCGTVKRFLLENVELIQSGRQ
ncbi:MAG: hypothetical protein P4L72_01265 [Parvibaculum sp.]|uniref:hypothetical protein n=1 Tax=Parvibaculum sp. TaxID=2024848 RepID=UPI002846365F|nr:hypothetical protein [Parvibaculum sp.]MDR3497836.1 hypothetical protein [Parvibaculum sp.]